MVEFLGHLINGYPPAVVFWFSTKGPFIFEMKHTKTIWRRVYSVQCSVECSQCRRFASEAAVNINILHSFVHFPGAGVSGMLARPTCHRKQQRVNRPSNIIMHLHLQYMDG